MSASESDKPENGRDGRFAAALKRARTDQATYLDSVEDVRAAATVRLQLLADDLAPVIEELPDHVDSVYCTVVPGDPPRFWIDLLAYVCIDDDGRTFKLLQNSANGRALLFETVDRGEIVEKVTEYIAHRTIEREREAAGSLARILGQPQNIYSGTALMLAWICGFAVGALVLLISGLIFIGMPGN